MRTRTTIMAVLLLACAAGARAIEIEIKENQQRIGFVDMQKIWKTYPETIRAKENFEELMRQAEEQINLRKVELIHLRNDLSQMKQERDYLAKTAPTVSVATTTAPAPQAPPDPAPVPLPIKPHTLAPSIPPAVSTIPLVAPPSPAVPAPAPRPDIMQLPGLSLAPAAASTAATIAPPQPPAGQPRTLKDLQSAKPATEPPAKKADQLVINIPGVSTAPVVVLPPAAVEAPKSTATALAVAASTVPAVNPALAELDAKIALKERELSKKETEFKEYQAAQEKNLLDLEKRKSDALLGKIDKAIKAVARQNGVAIMQEKSSLLMGSDAVDLTDQVVKFLQGAVLQQP